MLPENGEAAGDGMARGCAADIVVITARAGIRSNERSLDDGILFRA
jgi:hypothetical protein